MKTMQGYRTIATYTKSHDRWYHTADTAHQGPSVSLHAFAQGQRPAPLVECYAAPDTLRLVTERQAGQVPDPAPLPHPSREALACKTCGRVTGCRCGMPTPPSLAQIVAMQRTQGKRP
jgi:hypothetical protein